MRKAYRRPWFLFCMLFLLMLPVLPAVGKAEKELPFDLRREVLMTRLKNVLIANDINTIKRSLIDRRFSPLHAMPAYRELLLWSRKAADSPYWKDVVALVREGMVAIIRDSSMGLPLKNWAGEGNPVSIVYLNTFPAYKVIPDFSDLNTLKWRDDIFADVITPDSIGLSLTAKALLIGTDRSPEGKKYARMMLSSAIQELDILTRRLFLEKRPLSEEKGLQIVGGEKKIQGRESKRGVKMLLAPIPGKLGESTAKKVFRYALGPVAEGAYVPSEIKLPMDKKEWEVKNKASHLASQASLLEGLRYLYELLGDDALITPLLTNGKIEGKSREAWRNVTRRAIDVVLTSLMRHFDAVSGSFADSYRPDKGVGNRVVLDNVNRVVNVLNGLLSVFPDDAALQRQARNYILSQAAFIEKAQGGKNEIPRGYLLKNGAHIRGLMREFSSAISYISIMLTAEQLTGDDRYGALARKQFEVMHKIFWSKAATVYRLSAGLKVSTYTGASFAMVLEWLRKMDAMMPRAVDTDQYVKDYIEVVLKHSGLLQSEGPATGEVHQPEYYVENELEDLYLRLRDGGVKKLAKSIEAFVDHVSDQDGDGILGVRFSGYKTGGAPVITMQVGVATPIISGVGRGREGEVRRNYGF